MKTHLKVLAILLLAAFLLGTVSAVAAEGAKEPITLKVYLGEFGMQPTADNKIYKKIEEELGVKFEFEYQREHPYADDPDGDGDPDAGLEAALNEVINRETLPDLIDGGNYADMLENSDTAINLMQYISEEKTPNLYEHITKDNQLNRMQAGSGQLNILPNYGIVYNDDIATENYGPAFHIQKKVIEWNNYVVPTTLNEYFDLIERYVAAHPTDESGNPTVGYEFICEDWRNYGLVNPVQHLMGQPNDGEVIVNTTTSEYKTETFIDKPYAKAYYAKLNEAWNKGLINKNTFGMTYDEYIETLVSGNVVGMFDQRWDFTVAEDELINQERYGDSYLSIPLVYDPEYVNGQEIEEHYINGSVINVHRGFTISPDCEDPERVVQLFETLLSDEWQTILNWGIEGEDYYIDENGRMMMTQEQYARRFDADWQQANRADQIFNSMPKKQGTMDNGNAWDPDDQPEIVNQAMNDYDKAFLAACGKETYGEFFNSPLPTSPYGEAWQLDAEPVGEKLGEFRDIETATLPEIITAAPEEVDSKWDAFVEAIAPSAAEYSAYMQQAVVDEVLRSQGNLDPVIPAKKTEKTLIQGEDGIWRYHEDGEFVQKTGLVDFADQVWYVENGVLDAAKSGFTYVEGEDAWVLLDSGRVQKEFTGLAYDPILQWWLVKEGKVDFSYTGLYNDAALGWWLVQSGSVDVGYNGLFNDPTLGWWLIANGQVNADYVGLWNDPAYGWWLIDHGTVATYWNGLWNDPVYGWWLVKDGAADFGYTGLYNDPNHGWWLIGNGQIAWDYSGIWDDPVVGKWMIENARPVAPVAEGLMQGEDGVWRLFANGEFVSGFTGLYQDKNLGWWLVRDGLIDFGYVGLWNDPVYGWWIVDQGAVAMEYNGLWNDPVYGWWLVQGGTVAFGYDGEWVDPVLGTVQIVGGQVVGAV